LGAFHGSNANTARKRHNPLTSKSGSVFPPWSTIVNGVGGNERGCPKKPGV
jgi:hypothetical protein